MVTVTFEGETHAEVVEQVREWLETVEPPATGPISPAEAIEQGAGVTKDALRIIASSAPSPIQQSELVKRLTEMGYKATDATKVRLIDGLDRVEDLTGGGVVKRVQEAGRNAMYEMPGVIANQLRRNLSRT